MRARRHSRLYAAALHPAMRVYVEDAPANAIVPFFYGLHAAFQMRTYGSRKWTRDFFLFCSANDRFLSE